MKDTDRGTRLVAPDVARALAAIGVVAIHAVGYSLTRDAAGSTSQLVDQALVLSLRFSRLVFMLLSGFALAYVYRSRPLHYKEFLTKRVWRTALPYLGWSGVYLGVSSYYGMAAPPGSLGALVEALLLGTAFYHLYFVSVSLQWYAIFPPVLAAARRLRGRGVWYAAALAAAGYLGLCAWFTAGDPVPAWAGWLPDALALRDRLLVSYLGYYLLGTLAGLHGEVVLAWLRRHLGALLLAVVGCVIYLVVDMITAGPAEYYSTVDVFRPAMFLYGLAMTALLLALSARLATAGGWLPRWLLLVARHSYAIYLAHPLVLFLVEYYGFRQLPWNSVLTLPLTAIGFLASLGLAHAAEQVRPLARLLLGKVVPRLRPAQALS